MILLLRLDLDHETGNRKSLVYINLSYLSFLNAFDPNRRLFDILQQPHIVFACAVIIQ